MLALAIGLNVTVFTIMDAMLFRGYPLVSASQFEIRHSGRHKTRTGPLRVSVSRTRDGPFLIAARQAGSPRDRVFASGDSVCRMRLVCTSVA